METDDSLNMNGFLFYISAQNSGRDLAQYDMELFSQQNIENTLFFADLYLFVISDNHTTKSTITFIKIGESHESGTLSFCRRMMEQKEAFSYLCGCICEMASSRDVQRTDNSAIMCAFLKHKGLPNCIFFTFITIKCVGLGLIVRALAI